MNRREFLLASALGLSACLVPKTLIDGEGPPPRKYLPLIMKDHSPDLFYLPRYLMTNPGTLYEGFQNASDWTVTDGTLAANFDQYKIGSQSLRLTCTPGTEASMIKTVNWDMSGDWGRLLLWFYVNHDLNDPSDNKDRFVLSLSNDETFTNYFQCYLYNLYSTMNGWNTMTWAKGDMEAINSPSWSDPIVRVRLQCGADDAPDRMVDVSFASLYFGIQSIPAAQFSFVNGSNQQYDNAFLYMKQLGINGTLWAETDLVGVWSDYLSWAKVQEMAASGWIVGNKTNSGTPLDTKIETDQEAQIKGAYDTLNSKGLSAGSRYVFYPGGYFNEDTITAMTNLSMLTGQTTRPTSLQGELMFALPFGSTFTLPSNEVNSTMTVADWESMIDRTIAGGYVLPLHWNKIGTTGQMSTADFKTCMDYFKSKKDAGLIYDLTIDDLYKLTLGPVGITKP